MDWDKTEITLEAKSNSKVKAEFKYLGSNTIRRMSSSCNCTTPSYDKEKKTLSTYYKSGGVPYHLKSRGYYLTEQTVKVYYEEVEDFDTLRIKVKVTE